MSKLRTDIQTELDNNNGKLSFAFINELAQKAKKLYLKPTERTRVCVLTLEATGHEVVGFARVLDPANDDDAKIGNEVAFDNARNELWAVCGAIALSL